MKSVIYLYVGGALCLFCALQKYGVLNNKDLINKAQKTTYTITHSSRVESRLLQETQTEKSLINDPGKLSGDPNQLSYVIEKEQQTINEVLKDYPFRNGTKLNDYVYKMGGNPIKALVSEPDKCKNRNV